MMGFRNTPTKRAFFIVAAALSLLSITVQSASPRILGDVRSVMELAASRKTSISSLEDRIVFLDQQIRQATNQRDAMLQKIQYHERRTRDEIEAQERMEREEQERLAEEHRQLSLTCEALRKEADELRAFTAGLKQQVEENNGMVTGLEFSVRAQEAEFSAAHSEYSAQLDALQYQYNLHQAETENMLTRQTKKLRALARGMALRERHLFKKQSQLQAEAEAEEAKLRVAAEVARAEESKRAAEAAKIKAAEEEAERIRLEAEERVRIQAEEEELRMQEEAEKLRIQEGEAMNQSEPESNLDSIDHTSPVLSSHELVDITPTTFIPSEPDEMISMQLQPPATVEVPRLLRAGGGVRVAQRNLDDIETVHEEIVLPMEEVIVQEKIATKTSEATACFTMTPPPQSPIVDSPAAVESKIQKKEPQVHKASCFLPQHRVPWQPVFLPPPSVKLSF